MKNKLFAELFSNLLHFLLVFQLRRRWSCWNN